MNARPLLMLFPLVCACGSSAPPSAQDAQATVQRYFGALADVDPDGVCHELSPAAQDQVARQMHVGSCKEAAKALKQAISDADRRKLKGARIGTAHVSGSRATVVVATPGHTSSVPLEVRDGRWQISRLSVQ